MIIPDNQMIGMMKAGLDRFLKSNKGSRLDKRSATAGYYAAAAFFAAAVDKEEPMVEAFVDLSTNAIGRKPGWDSRHL